MFVRQYIIGSGHFVQREVSDELADSLPGTLELSGTPFPGTRFWDDEVEETEVRRRVSNLVSHMTDSERAEFVSFVIALPNSR